MLQIFMHFLFTAKAQFLNFAGITYIYIYGFYHPKPPSSFSFDKYIYIYSPHFFFFRFAEMPSAFAGPDLETTPGGCCCVCSAASISNRKTSAKYGIKNWENPGRSQEGEVGGWCLGGGCCPVGSCLCPWHITHTLRLIIGYLSADNKQEQQQQQTSQGGGCFAGGWGSLWVVGGWPGWCKEEEPELTSHPKTVAISLPIERPISLRPFGQEV